MGAQKFISGISQYAWQHFLSKQKKTQPSGLKLQREQCYQSLLGKHGERIKPTASREGSTSPPLLLSSSPPARAMDLKVVCALSITLIIALSTLAEGSAPPSKYLHVLLPSRYGWDPHPTEGSQSLPALAGQTENGFLCCCSSPKWSLLYFLSEINSKERLQLDS